MKISHRLDAALVKAAIVVGAICCLPSGSSAQTSIWTNPITGTSPNTNNPYVTGDVTAANLTVSGIGRGPGISGSNANDRYSATGWATAGIDLNDYFSFTLTPATGFEIDLNSFVYTGQASGTGPNNFAFRSSLDSFASNLGTPNVGGTTISLSGASFQNLTNAISFRFYAWGGTGGTFSINSFAYTGAVSAVIPAGSTYYWTADGSTLGGAGTWNTSGLNWSASDTTVSGAAWDSSKLASFGGSTGSAVTVDTVTASKGIQFTTTGYSLTNGTLTLGGATSTDNTLTTATGVSATIASTLSGSAAIAKSGLGTLTLNGNNGFSGALSIDSGALRATSASALGSSAAGTTVASGAALELDGGVSIVDEALGLTGTGISSGGALRNISGDNTYGGVITLNGASRVNSDAGTLTLDVSSGNAVTGTQNVTFGGAGNVAVNDPIATSTGTLTKDGVGTLSLNAANTYTGSTTVSGGTLKLGAAGSIASTAVSVGTGATLDLTEKASGYTLGSGTTLGGSGTVSLAVGQSLAVGTGSIIQAGSATSNGTLTLSGLVFDGGGTYNFSIGNVVGAAGTNWDLLTASQSFAINATSGSKFIINVAGNSGNPTGFANTGNYSWDIATLSAGNISGFNANAFTLNNGFTGSDGTLTLTSDGTKLTLNYLAGTAASIGWSSAGGSAWLTAGNWTGGSIPGPGDVAQFGANPTGTTVGINMGQNAGAQSVGAIELTSTRASALSVTNSSGTTPGVLTLAGVNVNGTQNVILRNNSGQTLTLANGATQTMGVALGNATDNVIVIDGSGGITIASAITGTGRSLTLSGTGTGALTLSGANTYTGPTSILDGRLILALNSIVTSDVTVGALGAIGGRGTITGDLSLDAGADFVFDLNGPLLVNNGTVSFGGLSIADIVGLTSATPEGIYTLIDGIGTTTFDFSNVSNFGFDNQVSIGGDKFAYFKEGSLQVEVVPEPSTYALLSLAAAGLGAHLIRRRRR